MPSIKSSLVKQVTLIIAFFLFCLLFLLDITIDTYLESQFDDSLIQEGRTLVNLISTENSGISLSLHAELIKALNTQSPTKYFQLWSGNQVINESKFLAALPKPKTPEIELTRNEYIVKNIELADGKSGRIFIYNLGDTKKSTKNRQRDVYLGLTRVSNNLENTLIFIYNQKQKIFFT